MWQLAETAMPTVVGLVIGRAIEQVDESALWWGVAAIAAVTTVTTIGYRFGERFAVKASTAASRDLQMIVTRRMLRPDGVDPATAPTSGDVYRAATADAESAARACDLVASAGGLVVSFLAPVAVLMVMSPILGAVILASLVLVVIGLRLAGKVLHRREAETAAASSSAISVATDLVRGIRVVKGLRAETAASERYTTASQVARRARVRAAWTTGQFRGSVNALSGVLMAIVALVGGKLALDGDLGAGELIAVLGVTRLLVTPLQWGSYLFADVAAVRAGTERVLKVITSPAAVSSDPAVGAPESRLGLRLDGVELGGEPASFSIEAGEYVAVVAAPGASRQLAEILGRERNPATGTVHLGGRDLAGLDPDAARELMLVSPHDAALFDGTLRDNIAVRAAGSAAIDAAVVATTTNEIVAAVPGGLDAQVGDRGSSLSGGQRQRVALARALAAETSILVLHDPTTAIDSATEALVADGIRSVREGRTTIVIATNPALLAVADRVILVGDAGSADGPGGVDGVDGVMVGAHHELLERSADYRARVLA